MPNSPIEFNDKTDFLQTRLLQVNSCGSEHVVKYDYTILRSKGRRDFHFLYLRSGWLDAEIGTVKVRLQQGQCAVFLPNVRQMYAFTAEGSPVSYFLHFTGEAAAEAMKYLQPNENMVFTITDQVQFESLFHRLTQIHNLEQNTALQIPEENSILLQIITILCRCSNKNDAPIRRDISKAMEYMRDHMQDQINFQDFADHLHLSYSHFAHMFTQTVGVSPLQYLLKLRLDRARGLLRDSSMSITEIAESIGFNDAFYFSRMFSKSFGMSPRAFRNECRK